MDAGSGLWLFTVAVGASGLGGMLGMASGIFIVPILILFGHIAFHTAIAASIISVIACSCGSAGPFLSARLTNIRLAIVLETATTLGALIGVLLTGIIPVNLLYFLFALILLVSARQMMARRGDPAHTAGEVVMGPRRTAMRLDSSYPDRSLGREVAYQVHRLPLGMVLMLCAGLVSALLGIGSGVLKIPAMDTALRLPLKVSSATSNFMIGVTAAASGAAYFFHGDVVAAIAGPVALGSVVGSVLGARVVMTASSDRLRLLFVAVLVVLAAQMLLSGFGINPMASPS